MLYRKAPLQPGRLLLRVVAVAGAGPVLGAIVCCGVSSGVEGVVPIPDDAGHDGGVADASTGGYDGLTGSLANPDGGACEEGCGLVGNPDAAADVLVGLVPPPDGGIE